MVVSVKIIIAICLAVVLEGRVMFKWKQFLSLCSVCTSLQLFPPFIGNPSASANDPFLSRSEFHEIRKNYLETMKAGDIQKIRDINHDLLDYVFGTITTMEYGGAVGNEFHDTLDWRRKWKDIENRGDFIFVNEQNTQNEIRVLLQGLHDKYAIYKPPEQFLDSLASSQKQYGIPSAQKDANVGIEIRALTTNSGKGAGSQGASYIGAEVIAVFPDSAGERSGLCVGDLIVEIGKRKLKDISVSPQYFGTGNKPELIKASIISSPFNPFYSYLSSHGFFFRLLPPAATAAVSRIGLGANDDIKKSSKEVYEDYIRELLGGQEGTSIRIGILPRTSSYSFLHKNKQVYSSLSWNEEDTDDEGRRNTIMNSFSNNIYHITLKRDFKRESRSSSNLVTDEIQNPYLGSGTKIAYIRMKSFTPAATSNLLSALQSTNSPWLSDASLLLIDLRNNFGGIMQEALFDASLFFNKEYDVEQHHILLPKDNHRILCYTVTHRGTNSHEVSEWAEDPRLPSAAVIPPDIPVGILVNEGTASAAELFSAALRDNGRAVLIGSRTYGKGLIQHLFPLPDGGALKLTTGEYLTPKKSHIVRDESTPYAAKAGVGGLTPDVWCSDQPTVPVDKDQCVRFAIDSLL